MVIRRRIPTVDIVRGILMALIICTHAMGNLDPREPTAGAVEALCLLLNGTVGFATISGVLIGYFLIARAGDLARIFRRYAVRAAILGLVAHPLISIALCGPDGNAAPFVHFATHTLFITDDLAFIFLVVVPLTPRLSARGRLALGVAMMVFARIALLLPAHSLFLLLTRELLAGVEPPQTVLTSNYPLLSLTGMFLIGSWIGDKFATAERDGRLPELARRLLVFAGWLVALAAAMGGVWALCKWHVAGIDSPSLRRIFYPDYAFSGYPAYLAGTVLLMALLMTRVTVGPLQRFFLTFGRMSLFTYVLHYYAVQTLPWLLHWRHRMHLWQVTLYLAVALPLLNCAAALYVHLTRPQPVPEVAGPATGGGTG